MTISEARVFIEELFRDVWRPFNDECLEKYYWPDVQGHHGAVALTLADMRNRLAYDRRHFRDAMFDVLDLVASDNTIALRFHFTAILVDTGERISTDVAYFYHLIDNKIAEWWVLADVPFDYKANA
jgi:predicted ester cyclase